jgi:hypothetical protein
LVILYEYMHFFRVIPLNGRPHSKDVDSTWMGDSVAKWEGDTLVIDTVGLKEWMLDATHDSHPDLLRMHSDNSTLSNGSVISIRQRPRTRSLSMIRKSSPRLGTRNSK